MAGIILQDIKDCYHYICI